jgi:uncharacterized protein YjbI with pentapeptide repeats
MGDIATPPITSAYVGPRPFGDNDADRELFFARETDCDALLSLVLSERLSLLYARSGLGKTSLINTCLLKELRDRDFFPAVIRVTHRKGDPLGSLFAGISELAQRVGVRIGSPTTGRTLWHFFDSASFMKGNSALRPVLILDQFEELFTTVRLEAPDAYARFVLEVADLARGRMPDEDRKRAIETLTSMSKDDPARQKLLAQVYQGAAPDVRILVSIREDFLPELEDLENRIPGIFRNTYRLRRFSADQARQAIEAPLRKKELLGSNSFEYETGTVEEIIDFLARRKQSDRPNTSTTIEPFQLQLLCNELDLQRRRKRQRKITRDQLGGAKGMRRILGRYYTRTLKSFPVIEIGWNARRWRIGVGNAVLYHLPRISVRELCERGLITASRRRTSLISDDVRYRFGVAASDLQALVSDHRLLRSEPRLNSQFYELTHDSLVEPILGQRRLRRMARWAVLLPVIIAFFVLPSLTNYYESLRVAKKDNDAYELVVQLRDGTLTPARRKELVQKLLDAGYTNFSNTILPQIELRGQRNLYGASFRDADLSLANLAAANLGNAHFERAKLDNADLSSAYLANAKFERASLKKANFSSANAFKADFANADLSGAQLVETEMEGASVRNVVISSDTNLRGTAWWFAMGWTDADIEGLENQWPHTRIVETNRFKNDIERLNSAIDKAPSNFSRAEQLNNRSWYRATRGVDLRLAQVDAENSVRLLRKLPEADIEDPLNLYRVMDTLGYVLVQLGDNEGAVKLMREAAVGLRGRFDCSQMAQEARESYYHLGTVLERLGRDEDAKTSFACAGNFLPTHERLLTRRSGKLH